jgi:hypothetical protein
MLESQAECDAPGSDPSVFLPEINRIENTDRLPPPIAKGWTKCFGKEVRGLIVTNRTCGIEDPNPDDIIIPIMAVFKTKLDKDGMLDKLKARCVFRGDLYNPRYPLDSWNPHANFQALFIFLALCARYKMFPCQIDLIMAYLQARMRERVFVIMPEGWKKYLPEDLHKWIGRPLLLLKALYGYTFSGKFLYEEIAEFLTSQGLEETSLPGLWFKRLDDNRLHLFLVYSDDMLSACNDTRYHQKFQSAFKSRFNCEIKPRADWYLQTRIQQDSDGNITVDQSRYCKHMVNRFLPSYLTVTPDDRNKRRYASPA